VIKYFFIVETYSPLIPLITFCIKKPKRSAWAVILISYLIIYVFLSADANFFHNIKNNIVTYIIISMLTFCFFALIFEQFLSKKKFKIINRTAIIMVVLFFIFNAIWWEGAFIFNSYSSGVANLLLVGYCLYYYKLQLENPHVIFVEKQSSFWIVSGILIYCAGNFFLFSAFNSLTTNYPDFAFYSWNINIFLILIMNIFFAKGLQCNWHQ